VGVIERIFSIVFDPIPGVFSNASIDIGSICRFLFLLSFSECEQYYYLSSGLLYLVFSYFMIVFIPDGAVPRDTIPNYSYNQIKNTKE
jgi:hypothetical protein